MASSHFNQKWQIIMISNFCQLWDVNKATKFCIIDFSHLQDIGISIVFYQFLHNLISAIKYLVIYFVINFGHLRVISIKPKPMAEIILFYQNW